MNSHRSTNNRLIAKNAIFLYIRMLVLILVSLYTTRILLKALGIDDYGIFNVVGGLIVMVTFINQGLMGASQRYIMAEMTSGNINSQRQIYTNVMIAHIIMCVLLLFLGETLGLWFFSNYLNIPEGRFDAAMWVYHLSLFSSILHVMLSPFNAVIVSQERMSAYAYFSIIDAILRLAVVWIVMFINGDKLIMYSVFLLSVGLVNIIMYYIYCRRMFQMCRVVNVSGTRQLKALFGYMGWTVFGLGAHVASRQGVTMLVNIFYSVAANAAIGVSNMIIGAASKFVTNFQMAFAPQLTKNYISEDYNELNILVNKASRYSSLLVLLILIPISAVITDLLSIWLGEYPRYTEEFCIYTLVCIYIDAMSNPLIKVITADQDIKKYQIIISSIYMMDLGICWFVLFLRALPYSVIIVRVVFCVVGLILRLIMVRHRVIGFSARIWFFKIIGRGMIIVLCSTPLIAIKKLLTEYTLLERFVTVGFISIVWVVFLIWYIGLSKNERMFLKNKTIEILNKTRQ